MSNKQCQGEIQSGINNNMLCKYEQYINYGQDNKSRKSSYQSLLLLGSMNVNNNNICINNKSGNNNKKLSHHKHRLSGLLPPPSLINDKSLFSNNNKLSPFINSHSININRYNYNNIVTQQQLNNNNGQRINNDNDNLLNINNSIQKKDEKIIKRIQSKTNNNTQRKSYQMIKLQKLFPKSVTIKFQDVLDTIPNNNSFNNNLLNINSINKHNYQNNKSNNQNNSNNNLTNNRMSRNYMKLNNNKTISPLKIFQIAQNKFYLQLFNQKKKQQQFNQKLKQSNQNHIQSLFNVKSIKMINKFNQSNHLLTSSNQQSNSININQTPKINNNNKDIQNYYCSPNKQKSNKRKKYQRMFQKQNDFSINYQNQNPSQSNQTNNHIKLSLKDIKKYQQLQSSTNIKTKRNQLLPLSQLKNREKHKTQNINLQKFNTSTNQIKSSHRSSSMLINKRRNSKELTPMIFSLNQDMNSSFAKSKLFDHRYMMVKKPDIIFDQKFIKYISLLKSNAQIHEIEITFPETYSRNQFNFYVSKGNNSKLVKQTLKKRWWLGSCQDKKDLQKNNVVWTQLKDKSYYSLNDKNIASEDKKQSISKKLIIHNHFEQNEFLGNKKALFYNMRAYYQNINQDVFNYLPYTFHITSLQEETWQQFLNYFNKIKQQNPEGKNVWILKPGENSNRGNGITVHENVDSIKTIVNQCQKTGRTFILQKYIQKPFLYNKRKFDIRCYMLLTRLDKKIKGFWYKQGYIRTSGYQYTLQDCDNSFIHLTNDAIQQNCDNYGKYQDKNKLSYQSFQKYLDLNYNNKLQQSGEKKFDFERDILPKLRKVCIDSIKACYKSIGKWRQGLATFELFGLDFMIDEQFNPWLIQINTNPCLQTQGRVLQKVIVPLVDNVMKMTVDCLIPPPLNWSNSNKHLISKNVDRNYFELVFDQSNQIENNQKNDSMKQLPMDRIGQIDQDNQIYQENQQ